MKQPLTRYSKIADELAQAIAEGEYAVGDLLPNEHALASRFAASRHTIREALRKLAEQGLIERKQGSGTRVRSANAPISFNRQVRSIDDFLQYRDESRLKLRWARTEPASKDIAEPLMVAVGTSIRHLHGQRRDRISNRMVGLVDIYRRERRNDAPLDNLGTALESMLVDFDIRHLSRIEQEISARIVAADQAAELEVPPGTAVLRLVRRYFDGGSQPFAVGIAVHPGDSFSYRSMLENELPIKPREG